MRAITFAMLRTILCPVDFSPGSRHAMRVAIRLAREAKAHLALVHVWHVPALATAGEVPIDPGTIQALVDDATRLLADAGREATELGAPDVATTLRNGSPWSAIVELAEHERPDLIVMGTHGRGGVSRFLVGSVAESVVRHAPCGVLVVRGDAEPAPYRDLLCPVDFSDGARLALDRAAELAAPGGRGIELLHVVEVPNAYSWHASLAAPVGVEDRARGSLAEWADQLRAKTRVEVTTRVQLGSPATAIVNALSERPFDLVVMGSHGRTGVRRLLLGSVAERTVRHAPCSVLVARGGA